MKHNYLLAALLLAGLSQPTLGQTAAWRPFRPGRVYGFTQNPGTTTVYTVRTLRVDSAYATAAGDSVYAFNRLLRPVAATGRYFKSRNNLFGARLRWQPGTQDYYLEANAEPATGQATPVALLLRPRAAVGSTWAASTQPTLTATLSSRTGSSTSPTDSVATITLSNGQQFVFSRANGLVQGPQWLALSATATGPASQWRLFGSPAVGLGIYNPRTLFNMGVGDELGYTLEVPYLWGALLCQSGYSLRRVTARTVTADSLLITYREQRIITTSSMPNCGGQPGTVLSPVQQKRWAFSLRTGASPQFPFLALLTGEYRPYTSGLSSLGALAVGGTYSLEMAGTSCLNHSSQVSFFNAYPNGGVPGQYAPGLDALGIGETYDLGAGMGPSYFQDAYNNQLTYFRKGSATCGSAINFATLLPTRAAEAAAAATLHPNPAADAATLTLAAPALPGTTLALTDALGRRVWSTVPAPGQTALSVPLSSQPAGLYLVQLLAPGAAPLTWKLVH